MTVADIFDRAVRSGAGTSGLATGSSPLSSYRELIRRHREEGLSFAAVRAFLLDKYVGLPAGHSQSYAPVSWTEFADHVDLREVFGPDGGASDLSCAAAAWSELRRQKM